MANQDTKGDFCITIDFDKNSPNPERVFQAMTDLITAFKEIDNTLIKTIDHSIKPILILEDIETGSLKTWLRNLLNHADDDALKNLDWKPLVGQYLVKAKYIMIDFLDGKTKITDAKEIKILQIKINEIAQETGIRNFPDYGIVKQSDLIYDIEKLNRALDRLDKNDKVYYTSTEGDATFNMDFEFAPEEIEDLLTRESLTNTSEMILKVKKPDYLGTSKWQFKHDTKTIEAKISDKDWLARFQARQEDVRPGDSVKALVKIVVKYGHDSTVIATQYEIVRIDGIITNLEEDIEELF